MWAEISGAQSLRLVIGDLSNSPYLDVAGANMLAGLHHDLAAARSPVADRRSAGAPTATYFATRGWRSKWVTSADTCRSIKRSRSFFNPLSRTRRNALAHR